VGWLSLGVMVLKRGPRGSTPSIMRDAMDYYAGIYVSLELSSICILDASGQIVCEAKVASDPDALAAFLACLNVSLTRVGLEASPLSQWRGTPRVSPGRRGARRASGSSLSQNRSVMARLLTSGAKSPINQSRPLYWS